MPRILAIDPGPIESAWILLDAETCKPIDFGKEACQLLMWQIEGGGFDDCSLAVVEMVASYGMAVGAEVFETCVWIGRYEQALRSRTESAMAVERVTRRPIKLHHCGVANAKDSNITQALIDRFGSGAGNRGKGTKAAPGWFYGFRADVWQAYALGVYAADALPWPSPQED
jgi:hypothetical protein